MIDLRSDTVTRPCSGMFEAMRSAALGDDVLGDDPTVTELENKVASLLGKESAVFVPSGTMGNQIALAVHVRPGDAALFDEEAHMLHYEVGAPGAIAGALCLTFRGQGSDLPLDEIERKLWKRSLHTPQTTCVCLENTHNRLGGAILDQSQIVHVSARAKNSGAKLHLDGARLWNAAVASGSSPAELVAPFDSVSVCLSKALGAPVGSVLVGSAEFIDQARYWRKRLGGGMRQSGLLAAAGIYALDNNLTKLADDHRRARELAEFLGSRDGLVVTQTSTNIVLVDVPSASELWIEACARHGVSCVSFGPQRLRFVTHLDFDDEQLEQACLALQLVADEMRNASSIQH